MDHPLNVYKMIKKWRRMLASAGNTAAEELQDECQNLGLPYVTDVDLMGTMAALIRLQRTYNLSTTEMATGNIQGYRTEPLTLEDSLELGLVAVSLGEYKYGAEWLELAATADPDAVQYSVANANVELAKVYALAGDNATATRKIRKAMFLDPFNKTINEELVANLTINKSMSSDYGGNPFTPKNRMQEYERLCRGDKNNTNNKNQPQMFCRYRKTSVPYYVIKEEVLSVDPWIAQLYDVIHEYEIQLLKDMATPQLYRAHVSLNSSFNTSDMRVGKVAWLTDDMGDPYIPMLSKRVSLITGLDTSYKDFVQLSGEPFQVVNYGVGGQYEPHVDYLEEEIIANEPALPPGCGNRMATFMFYLSNVTIGGATVFPIVDVRVPTVKGSAAYWFNMKKSGEYDGRTEHAGCPVLIGEKWVANKWMWEYGQEFRRPCGLTADAEEDGY